MRELCAVVVTGLCLGVYMSPQNLLAQAMKEGIKSLGAVVNFLIIPSSVTHKSLNFERSEKEKNYVQYLPYVLISIQIVCVVTLIFKFKCPVSYRITNMICG